MNRRRHSWAGLRGTLAGVLIAACSHTSDASKQTPTAGSAPASSQPSAAGVQAPGPTKLGTVSMPTTALAGAGAPIAGTAGRSSATAGTGAAASNVPSAGVGGLLAGMSGSVPPSAAAATAGTSASTPALACQKGNVKASEVIVMGESFYALNRNILNEIEKDAKAAGALAMSESYRNYSVSGQLLTGTIPSQFDEAIGEGPVKVVIMDGGGNDCMSSPCEMCPATFETLLKTMSEKNVETVIYTRYPEPGNPPGSLTTLKSNLDSLMPKMEAVCMKALAPKCYWVDLRPVWKDGDTSDGLHPTVSGGQHVGDAIWAKMVEQCIAQ